MFKCSICDKEYDTKQKYAGHMSGHKRKKKPKNKRSRNTLTNCRYCNKEFTNGRQVAGHENHCKLNPNSKNILNKMIENNSHPHTDETKKILSEKQKIAHAEGRAWNIGKSRWNNEPSYPEKFFMKVIKNEFLNKNYKREFNVGIYSIDFAWAELKKAIEIDGEQYYRFEEYIERDKRKDDFLKSEGWKILRIRWKTMYKNTKPEIEKAYNFIHN